MTIQKNNQNSINFINILMKQINSLTDDVYESLMDEDNDALRVAIKELHQVLRDTQKLSDDEI
jgi:cobalamin biosynthesis protein CobD/CbiB